LSSNARPDPKRLSDPSKYFDALETAEDLRNAVSSLISIKLAIRDGASRPNDTKILIDQVFFRQDCFFFYLSGKQALICSALHTKIH
jgi:hypothetical protein